MEIYEASVSLMVRALVVSARWAARSRRLGLERACACAEAGRVAQLEARVVMLEDALAFRDARLEVLERRLGEERPRRPYPLLERLHIPRLSATSSWNLFLREACTAVVSSRA